MRVSKVYLLRSAGVIHRRGFQFFNVKEIIVQLTKIATVMLYYVISRTKMK